MAYVDKVFGIRALHCKTPYSGRTPPKRSKRRPAADADRPMNSSVKRGFVATVHLWSFGCNGLEIIHNDTRPYAINAECIP
jgi:hypothetical protein